jgi:GNAT superfamily N-acetyltransferase
MTDNLTIRVAGDADVPHVLRLYAQPALDAGRTLDTDAAMALLQRFKRYPDYRLYIACFDEQVVGTFALLIMDNLGHQGRPSAVIEDVAVEPTRQGQGVGRRMLEFALQQARMAGCYKLALSTAQHRVRAHRFYESLGFERHGYSYVVPFD